MTNVFTAFKSYNGVLIFRKELRRKIVVVIRYIIYMTSDRKYNRFCYYYYFITTIA